MTCFLFLYLIQRKYPLKVKDLIFARPHEDSCRELFLVTYEQFFFLFLYVAHSLWLLDSCMQINLPSISITFGKSTFRITPSGDLYDPRKLADPF